MKYILIIIAIISLASCRTVKNAQTVKTVYDSTYVKKYDSLAQVKREDSAAYVATIEMLSENTIIFQDTGRTIIEYYPDGNIKTVEGRVKHLSSQLSNVTKEAGYYKSKYDSLVNLSTVDSVQVQKEYVTITKTVKRSVLPWWLILVAAGVLIVGWRLGKIK